MAVERGTSASSGACGNTRNVTSVAASTTARAYAALILRVITLPDRLLHRDAARERTCLDTALVQRLAIRRRRHEGACVGRLDAIGEFRCVAPRAAVQHDAVLADVRVVGIPPGPAAEPTHV